MMFSQVSFSIFVFAFCSLILVLQVRGGFPPFYFKRVQRSLFSKTRNHIEPETQHELDQDLEKIVKTLFAIMPFLLLAIVFSVLEQSTLSSLSFLCAGMFILWFVKKLRMEVKNQSGGVQDWLLNSLTIRYPMLIFDVWVWGLSILFLGITVA